MEEEAFADDEGGEGMDQSQNDHPALYSIQSPVLASLFLSLSRESWSFVPKSPDVVGLLIARFSDSNQVEILVKQSCLVHLQSKKGGRGGNLPSAVRDRPSAKELSSTLEENNERT